MSFGPKLVSQLYPSSKRGRETNVAFLFFTSVVESGPYLLIRLTQWGNSNYGMSTQKWQMPTTMSYNDLKLNMPQTI